jgi:hypothetical protein
LLELAEYFVEQPHVEWENSRPFAFSRLSDEYAKALEDLAHAMEHFVRTLPIAKGWETGANKNPTTARFESFSAFHLSPITLPLYFAIRETYRHLLRALGQKPTARFIQCWFNIHRAGDSLVRHCHVYPFIGTFSAHASGSLTQYGNRKELSEADTVIEHVPGQLMITTGPSHYHHTSAWNDTSRARVTYAFDILGADMWNPNQKFLPFDI